MINLSQKRRSLKAVTTATALTLCGVLAACGGGGTGASDSKVPQRAGVATFGVATNEPIDQLNWGLPYGEPNTIDPPNTAYYSGAFVASNLCDPLLKLNADYSITSNLAEATQADDTTVVFKIRDGVTFWNGNPLTADDVVWSLNHAFAPSSVVAFLFTSVDSVTKTGNLEVTVKLKQPDSLFLQEIASFSGMVQEAKFSEAAGAKLGSAEGGLMCTGAYKLDKWTPGTSIQVSANPNYWNKDAQPRAKKVNITFVSDSNSLAQALDGGQLDGAYEVPAVAIPKLANSSAGNLIFGSPTQLYYDIFPVQPDGVLSNPEVRKALWMTIDRQGLADAVFHGAAEANYTSMNVDSWKNGSTPPAAQKLWSDAYSGFENERSAWGKPAAAAEAKKIAQQAGYTGEPVVLGVLSGDQTMSQMAQLIQAQANAAGFNVKIESLQPIKYSNALVKPEDRTGLDVMLSVSFNVAPNPAELMGFDYLPDNVYNYTKYNNRDVTDAVTQGKATLDPVERAKLLIKAQSIYENDYGPQTLLQLREVMFLRKDLAGATTSFAYMQQPSLALIGKSAR